MDKCDNHEATTALIHEVSNDLKWHNIIGKSIFLVGVALIGTSLLSLVYFGKLDERVNTLFIANVEVNERIDINEKKSESRHYRDRARIRLLESASHTHEGTDKL